MIQFELPRRDFLRLGLLVGVSTGLGACGLASSKPFLRATTETLPDRWRRDLPRPWRFKALSSTSGQEPFSNALLNGTDLLALGDGWLSYLPTDLLKPINVPLLRSRMDYQVQMFLESLGVEMARRVLPVGVSPWVLLFRNGERWLPDARINWDVLLAEELKGLVVLPQSPRVIISIANKIERPDALRKLRKQAVAVDDRYALNWILEGKARVALLPLQRCLSILRVDPRMSIALPQIGTPLNWTVLVRPSNSKHPLPTSWIEDAWEPPLMAHLMATGWLPPLPHDELRKNMKEIPRAYQELVLPPKDVWSRCWSLSTLNRSQQETLSQLWVQSTP